MFRTKLAFGLIVLVCLVLANSAGLYWYTGETEQYFQRNQVAHHELQSYMALSLDAYRHVKQLADLLVLDSSEAREQVVESQRRLSAALEGLVAFTHGEAIATDVQEFRHHQRELHRLRQIESVLGRILSAFDEIIRLNDAGRKREAWELLSNVLEQRVDGGFNHFVDAAISEEAARVAIHHAQESGLRKDLDMIAMLTSTLSILFATAIGVGLFGGIRRPIRTLMQGTRRIAAGDFGHRIVMQTHDEFAHLAESFNAMAADLERQRKGLLKNRAGLEDEVKARTRELEDANLELKQIDGTRRRFFADISHELKTPLSIIRGEAEVTLRGRKKSVPEYETALQRIVQISEQLRTLVEDLLLLARSESAGTRMELGPLSLDRLLGDFNEDAQALARLKGIKLCLQIQARGLVVQADRQRLHQLLLILVDNACRYSAAGSEVRVRLERSGDDALVTIEDNGIGMQPEELESVFKRYYRSKDALRIAPTGTGLGLSVAKALVVALQGRISIESALGEGTEVFVRFPLIEQRGESQ